MPPPPTERRVLSVSDLTVQIRTNLEQSFPVVWVAGEVTGFKRHTSGHMYLTLKDARSQIAAVIYFAVNIRLKFEPRDGMQVVVRGRLSVHDPHGKYQLLVEELEPKGIGAAELALRQLQEKLFAKGYFDPKRKKPLVRFPRRVALVTSAKSAAVRDMIELFSQRWPNCELIVSPCRVQGETAAQEIATALRMLNRLHAARLLQFHAIVIGRGGGSREDLMAFNEEIVADAIFESAVPVVSAVGHEIDVTIADRVADHRAETPSAAVVLLTPHRREFAANLVAARRRLNEAIDSRLRFARQAVDQIASRPALRRPLQRILDLQQRLDLTEERLHRAANKRLAVERDKVASAAAQLDSLSPLNVLRRGYSLTRTADGQLLRDATAARPGDVLVTRVATGEVTSRVEPP